MELHRTSRLCFLLSLIAALAVGMITHHFAFGGANAGSQDSGDEVRITARHVGDGRVEVGLQQRNGDAWGERQLPDARFLSAAVEPGVWRVSSGVPISPAEGDSGRLFCVVAHGGATDFFWLMVRGYVWQASLDLDARVRFVTSLEGSEQAAAINQCSLDGAAVIASTLADPDAVTDALLAAKSAGARIVTFNSGAEYAAAAGSEFHISLDDRAAGTLAATGFNDRGITGTVACVLHEQENVGLQERCEAFEQTYEGGDMIRMSLPESADADTIIDTIAARLVDPDQQPIHALLTLNADTLLAGFRAIVRTADDLDHDVQIVGVGANFELTREPLDARVRHVPFAINSLAEAQGYLITSAMQMTLNFHAPSSTITQPAIIKGTPFLYDFNSLRTDPREVAAIVARIRELFTAPDLD